MTLYFPNYLLLLGIYYRIICFRKGINYSILFTKIGKFVPCYCTHIEFYVPLYIKKGQKMTQRDKAIYLRY